jgi:hypothetical protein
MSDLQTISITIGILTACITVIIGVVNSIQSNKRAELNDQQTLETRQAQLYMQVYNRWNSREMSNAYQQVRYVYQIEYEGLSYDEVRSKFGPKVNPEAAANIFMLGTFFEGLGVLVKKGLIDITLIEDLLSQRVIWWYETAIYPS